MSNKQDLSSKLANARQQLTNAQAVVADLEAQLLETQPDSPALLASEFRSHRILDNMLEGCQIIGFDWRYIYLNTMAAFHGQRAKEALVGYTMMECYPGIENTDMFATLQRCMQERTVERMENEFTYPDGKTGWFELHIEPVPEGIFILSMDISEHKLAEKAEREQRLLSEILRDSLAVLTASLDVESVMGQLLEYSTRVIPSEAGTIILFEGDQGRIAYSRGYSPEAETFFKENLIPLDSGLFMKGDDQKDFYLAADTQTTPEWHSFPFTEWIRSSIGVLITLKGESIGLLIVDSSVPNKFTQQDVEHLKEFARYAALALENAYHVDQLEQRVNERTGELQTAKERVEAILNNSADGILVAYSDFTIQQTNTAFNKLFACQPDDYFGLPLTALLQTDDDPLTQTMQKGAIEGQVINMEVRARRQDRSQFDAELRIGFTKKGGFVCSIRDITQRKAQERQLRYQASLQQNVSDAVIVTNMDFRIQSWNKAAQRIYGWNTDEVTDKSVDEILKTEFNSADDLENSLRQLREKGWWQGEVIQYHKDGSSHHILGSVSLIRDENGVPFSVIAINHDITERKKTEAALRESEARYRLLAENVTDVILKTTPDGIRTFITPSCYTLLGYTPEELLGKSRFGIMHPEDRSESERITKEAIHSSQTFFSITQRLQHKAGHYVWVEATNNIIRNPETGAAEEVIAVVRDISERKRAEEAIHSKVEEEREFQRYLKALHEITIELTQVDDIELFYKTTVELGRERLGFERLALLLYEPQTEKAIGTFGTDSQGNTTDERQARFDPDPNGILWRAFNRSERFYIDENATLFTDQQSVGKGWNASAVLWNGIRSLGWLVADNLLSQKPASKPLLDILGLYALTIGTLLAQKQAEEALRESEEKFRLLLDAAPVATIITDATGKVTLVNVQAEKLFGYKRSELIGEMVDILVPNYASAGHVDNRRSYMAAPRVRQMGMGLELFAKRQNNSIFPVEIELSYIETKDGTMVMSFVVDITERKRAAAELERQRSFLRSVIDVSPSMIFVKDYVGRFVLANPMVAKMYNTTVDNLIGKTDIDFNPSPEEVKQFLEADQHVIASGEPLFFEEPITGFNGETRWVQTTKVPIMSIDGETKHVLGVATDITERKQSEAALQESESKYRSLIETMRGGLVIFDLDRRITFINDRFCELLGYSRDEYMGARASDYVDPSNLPTLQSQINKRPQLESSTYELLFRHKDGNPVYLLVSGSPLLGKTGEYIGSFAVVTDITAQKQAEDVLRQAFEKEKELGELKTRFVSMASHEFRTPLATILALTETLSAYRHKLPEDQIELRFNKIKDQVGHLKDIMEDVLQLARMQARRVEFNPVRVDLDALCRSVLDEFQSHADLTHPIEYSYHKAPHEVVLDKKLMRQIISNLVSNAIKYSPETKPIKVNLDFTDESLILSVRDEGIGIPESDIPHLFEPFHRAANVGAISGTGLGLVITKESVELHGGTIQVKTAAGIGTTFIVTIPMSIQEKK